MQEGQHRAIVRRIEKLVGMPRSGERPGFRLAIADNAGDDEIGIIEHRPERTAQRIAQLAALVNRARALRRCMAGYSSGKPKLSKELLKSGLVLADVWIHPDIGALEISVGVDGRAAMPGAADVQHVELDLVANGRLQLMENDSVARERNRSKCERVITGAGTSRSIASATV